MMSDVNRCRLRRGSLLCADCCLGEGRKCSATKCNKLYAEKIRNSPSLAQQSSTHKKRKSVVVTSWKYGVDFKLQQQPSSWFACESVFVSVSILRSFCGDCFCFCQRRGGRPNDDPIHSLPSPPLSTLCA